MIKSTVGMAAMAALFACGAADAQTRYFARGKLPAATSAANGAATPPARPKTLTCGGMVAARTVYPAEQTQYVAMVTGFSEGLAACNDAGAKYGEILKDLNHCMVSDQGGGRFYVYLNRGPIYDYVADAKTAYASMIQTGDYTYNP